MTYYHITFTHPPDICPGEPNSDPEKINALQKYMINLRKIT